MSSPEVGRQVRISRVGGRYLVFDIDDVVHIRRRHGICAIFTGTMPQNPTQNIFLGLPIELYAEEARLLVDKKAAYIADDATDHLSQLKALGETTARESYLQALLTQRKNAQAVFEDARAKSRAQHQHKRKPKTKTSPEGSETKAAEPQVPGGVEENEDSLFGSPAPPKEAPVVKTPVPAVTPTTSNALISHGAAGVSIDVPASYPLYAFLNSKGYYITPGLRFGGDYSVYPGDPFRFHAHYLANSYGWNEEIPMLDLVTSGRLGTAVKKSFLFGSQKLALEENTAAKPGEDVRVFCIEWAGM